MNFLKLSICALFLIIPGCSSAQKDLDAAIHQDNAVEIKAAIANGADIHAVSNDLRSNEGQLTTPLHYACNVGMPESTKALLEAGANPNAPFSDGKTPLLCAISAYSSNRAQVVEILLKHKANPNIGYKPPAGSSGSTFADARQSSGATPLMLASQLGEARIVTLLLKHGASVEHKDASGRTAFWYLGGKLSPVQEKRLSEREKTVRRLLLKAGANPDPRDNAGRTKHQYEQADDRKWDADFKASEQTLKQLEKEAVKKPARN